MNRADRLVIAVYYAIGGIVLGLGIAIFSSLYLGLMVSSPKILIMTIISCFTVGYLFSYAIPSIFKWMWKFFVN